jgi:hypothetical protein
MGWTTRVWFPAGAEIFSLPHRVQTDYGVHPASYPVDTRGSSGREADHSAASSAEYNNAQGYTSEPPKSLWRGA